MPYVVAIVVAEVAFDFAEAEKTQVKIRVAISELGNSKHGTE